VALHVCALPWSWEFSPDTGTLLLTGRSSSPNNTDTDTDTDTDSSFRHYLCTTVEAFASQRVRFGMLIGCSALGLAWHSRHRNRVHADEVLIESEVFQQLGDAEDIMVPLLDEEEVVATEEECSDLAQGFQHFSNGSVWEKIGDWLRWCEICLRVTPLVLFYPVAWWWCVFCVCVCV
jgi:hypothetical protein